jgi:hypothetical protein
MTNAERAMPRLRLMEERELDAEKRALIPALAKA